MRRFLASTAFAIGLLAGPCCATTPSLDGSAINANAFSVGSSGSVTLTTTLTNDTIRCAEGWENSTAQSVSSVTATGLTFTKVYSSDYNTGTTPVHEHLEIWQAAAASAQSSKAITSSLSGNVDSGSMICWGVNGAHNTSAPNDTNAGLPNTVQTGTPTTGNWTFSTTEGGDLVAAVLGGSFGSAGDCSTVSYTLVQKGKNTGAGTYYYNLCVYYQTYSTAQSGTATSIDSTQAGTGIFMADAITANPPLPKGNCTLAATGVSTGGC